MSERIRATFEAVRAEGRRAALMPYLMGGFPDAGGSRAIGMACAEHGADLLEVGTDSVSVRARPAISRATWAGGG